MSSLNLSTFTAFLLGINIGPHKRIAMPQLQALGTTLGFGRVKTLLATGNVIFDAAETDVKKLEQQWETAIKDTFGFEAGVIVKPMSVIKALIEANPFSHIPVTNNTRLYITFYDKEPTVKQTFPLRYADDFDILSATDGIIASVLTLGEMRSVDSMAVLKKMFGKKITTRNWNTILKVGI
jgi:uncharacterized protein (DUF1697 family)